MNDVRKSLVVLYALKIIELKLSHFTEVISL